MDNTPVVSVIMIFLNAEQFIQEAVESIFSQSYPDWELLLVDDGSTDRSTTIALRYASHHPGRVRYIEHPDHQNRGMSASRNLGVCHSRGKFIAFLDADDVWLPDKLKQQVALLENRPEAAMVYGPTQWWYSWTGKPEDRQRDFVHDLGVSPDILVQPPDLLVQIVQNEGVSPCTCSVLVRQEAIQRWGGFEEVFQGLYEDQAFFAKLACHAPVFVSSHCSARYRQHPGSNCSVMQETGQDKPARLVFLNWLSAYLSKQKIDSPHVWRAIQKEFWPYQQPGLHRLVQFARQGLPGQLYRQVRQGISQWTRLPIIRNLRLLRFRRLQPLHNGRQHGTPIVRPYWANFLQQYQSDIRGRALEIGTTTTIRLYGGQALVQAEAIDLEAHSPEVTVVADISRADQIPSDRYDCFVNQFTLHLIYDIEAALYHSVRILKPGGVLLLNFPCLDYYFTNGLNMGTGAPLYMHWWFTPIQVENMLRRVGLAGSDYKMQVYGNLFARVAYQMNMPAEELTRRELDFVDEGHPLLICVRAVKPANWQAARPEYRTAWTPDTTPAQWNPVSGHYPS